jgi:hypothetical protein
MDSMSGDYDNLLAAADKWVDFRVWYKAST